MKRKFGQLIMIALLKCFLAVSLAVAQEPATWREQMEYAKKLYKTEHGKDGNGLSFINYTYKGVISSEVVKSAVIDTLFSPDAIFPLILPSVITVDTTYSEGVCTITKRRYPKFEIITVGRLADLSDSQVAENNLEQIRQILYTNIQLGFEYVELEWDYKGKKITTLCIVSDERGGIVYDHIASRVTTQGAEITKMESETIL